MSETTIAITIFALIVITAIVVRLGVKLNWKTVFKVFLSIVVIGLLIWGGWATWGWWKGRESSAANNETPTQGVAAETSPPAPTCSWGFKIFTNIPPANGQPMYLHGGWRSRVIGTAIEFLDPDGRLHVDSAGKTQENHLREGLYRYLRPPGDPSQGVEIYNCW